jgi:predicted O-methyltransferase YrrM
MVYEIEIAWRTFRREGFKSLCGKLAIYFKDLISAIIFFFHRIPRNRNPESVVDFGNAVAGGIIRSAQVRSEIIQLAKLVLNQQPRTVVEIGTANGGTLFLWCQLAHPEATIISIDLPGGIHGGGYPYWKSYIYQRFASPKQKLHLLRGDSHKTEMLACLRRLLPDRKIDFLFIDGDHTYDGVKTDFEMYAGLVRQGGLVVLHDICPHPPEINCHVDRYWRKIKMGRRSYEFVENWSQGTCGIGVIEM